MSEDLKDSSRDKLASSPSEDTQPAAMIHLHDAAGNLVLVSREDWRAGTLEPMLRAQWDNPDGLYRACVMSLNDGFAGEPILLEAAQRLHAIDNIPERGLTILGIVLLKQRRIRDARHLYEAALPRFPESGNLRTNLAKVLWGDGEHEQSERVLREGLNLDPNQENGLNWWIEIQRRRGGQAAYVSALQEIAAISGSWRPQLMLAHQLLNERRNEDAIAMLRQSLAAHPDNGTVIDAVAGGFSRIQDPEGMIAAVGLVYDPARHEEQTGIALLRGYLALGRSAEGEALLARIEKLNRPHLKQILAQIRQQFSALKTTT
jgi:tetratricopeptide (TPR) repeat protein